MNAETLLAIREYQAAWKKWKLPGFSPDDTLRDWQEVLRAEEKMLEAIRKDS